MKKYYMIVIFITIIMTTIYASAYKNAKAVDVKNFVKVLDTKKSHKVHCCSDFKMIEYRPLTKSECMELKTGLGIKYCPYDNDHLAGAAKACGHINNLPTGKDLHKLAQKIYHTYSDETSIYGTRDDMQLKEMGIFINDSHIYYWTGEEAKDEKGGYVRMFASRGSIPYYAPRDGSGYVSHALGKVNYGDTKYIQVSNKEYDSNTVGLPNNDALVTVCCK